MLTMKSPWFSSEETGFRSLNRYLLAKSHGFPSLQLQLSKMEEKMLDLRSLENNESKYWVDINEYAESSRLIIGTLPPGSCGQEVIAVVDDILISGDKGISAFLQSDNLQKWVDQPWINRGAAGTVYGNLCINFPQWLFLQHTMVTFLPLRCHPRMDPQCNICLNIFKDKKSALYDVRTMLLSIQAYQDGQPFEHTCCQAIEKTHSFYEAPSRNLLKASLQPRALTWVIFPCVIYFYLRQSVPS